MGYGFLNVSTNYTYIFLIHILFWFVLLITTSQSAGVLHVPACNHDRPPLPGFTFYVHALCITKLSLLAVLIATPEAILEVGSMTVNAYV